MYRKEIEGFIDSHREEMIEDICTLCRINSEKMPYVEGKPYGEGPFQALQAALGMAEGYGFSIRNYDNYVGQPTSMTRRDSWTSWPIWTWFLPVRDGRRQSPLSRW